MPILLEVFLSIVRIFLLFSGVLLTFLLGNSLYNSINGFLASWSAPCLEIITYLVVVVPIAALFYGIHIQKYFWRRENEYNKKIFAYSFLFGLGISFVPVHAVTEILPTGNTCIPPVDLLNKFVYAMITGALTSLFAFIGMDIGVTLKHTSHHVSTAKHKSKTPRKTTKKRKK